jgi:hypothetical protein
MKSELAVRNVKLQRATRRLLHLANKLLELIVHLLPQLPLTLLVFDFVSVAKASFAVADTWSAKFIQQRISLRCTANFRRDHARAP